MENKNIDIEIADTIMERPNGFRIGGRHLYLYPITLGKTYLLSRLISLLEIDNAVMSQNPFFEAIRVCHEKKDIVLRILSYHTFKTKDELFDEVKVKRRIQLLRKLDTGELAELFLLTLSDGRVNEFIKYLGIDRDKKAQEKISRIKKDSGNSISFGGKSIYGTMIDVACERYGWSFEYVVWGISFANLRMLLADMINTTYLSDKEKKQLKLSTDRTYINADDPENMERIKAIFK